MKKKIIIAAAVIALASLLTFILLSKRRPFLYAGTVEATEVDISARLNAVIDEVKVREGAKVKKGETLVRLSVDDIRIAAERTGRDFERAEKLIKAGSINQETYDRAKFARDDAALRLSWGTIASPSDGTVLTRYHEPGEMVMPGTKLLTIADMSRVWAYIYVPQPVLARLQTGMEVAATVEGEKRRQFKGEIVKINDEAEFTPKNVQTQSERTRLVFGVKVEFDNPDGFLKPGMTVDVRLPDARSR
jgi:RND family efflux transporter, MFP subunit